MTNFRLKKQEPSESDILNSIGEYLTVKKHFFFRTNNAPVWQADGRGGGFFRKMSKWSVKGVPDFILIDDSGHFVGLEVKRKSGKPSSEQLEFQKRCKEKGAEYYIVKSIDDLINIGL